MAKQFLNLNDQNLKADTSQDHVAIPHCYEEFSTALDVSAVAPDVTVLGAGWMILRVTATGVHFPQKVTANAYVAPGAGEEYAGVLKTSILKSKPAAAVMTRGTVNVEAAPYKPLAGANTAATLKVINFTSDI